MEFFEAAANWAERSATVISFERDEFDGWFAKVSFRDSRGPYSAIVNSVKRSKGKNGETFDQFEDRVSKMLTHACAVAHKGRIKAIAHAKAA